MRLSGRSERNKRYGSSWPVAVCTAVLLLAAACGGSEAAAVASESAVTGPTSTPVDSPLEAELGFASEPARRQFQLITMQRAADNSIVQCMELAGFFYAVAPADDAFRSGAFVGDGSRDWTSVNGLGITSSFVGALASDPGSGGPDAAAANLDYVASLTNEQASGYDLALVGDRGAVSDAGDDPADASENPTGEYRPAGCWGAAFTDIVRLLAVIDEFEPQLASLNSRLDSDPRMLSFQQTWSTCMDAAGYRYGNESELIDDVYARLLNIELTETAGETQAMSREAVNELLRYEQQAAMASFDCRLGFADELARLRHDYEQEFLDDNRFRISELQPDT